jgi:ubiquinone/menaquinone biosynthesis C-methylase UbiE
MSKITLSESNQKLIKSVHDSFKEQHINMKFESLEDLWAEHYDIIKAEGWPVCKTYKDFDVLPEEIKKECVEVHKFSPDIYYKALVDEFNAIFNVKDSIDLFEYIESFFDSHPEILKDKKVIDLACGVGYWSLFCCNNQSLDVVGVDVRDDLIKVAKSIQHDHNINNVKFLTEDIHNYRQIEELCYDRDTVLLFGILYHVHDHLEILKAVCQPNVSHVVIETCEHSDIIDVNEPMIWWNSKEITIDISAGFYKGNEIIRVGYPNSAWFDSAMSSLNFKRVDFNKAVSYYSCHKIEKYKQYRSIYLYERIK